MLTTKTTVCGLTILVASLAIQCFVPRIPIAERRLVPVNRFPQHIGAWTCREDVPVDKEVASKCPTARFAQRIYQDASGNTAQLLLMTATGADDIHDPNICFPSQGWVVEKRRDVIIAGQPLTIMAAQQNGRQLQTVYWYTGYYQPALPPNSLIRHISALRTRLIGRTEGMSLFVRIMAPGDMPAEELEDFTKSVVPQVNAIVGDQAAG